MSKLRIETNLISRLLHHPDEAADLLMLGIEAQHFRDELLQKIFTFIFEHRRKHGAIPSVTTVEARFEFKVDDPEEPLSYYADEFIRSLGFFKMRDGVNEVGELLSEGDVEEAMARLMATVKDAQRELERKSVVSNVEVVEPRLERYDKASGASGVVGIPMPWKEFTEATMGWKPNEFGLIAARTGVGKTFYVLLNAHAAWSEGKRVLIFSMEMAPPDLHVRHDALIAEVPFDALRKGRLTPAQEKRYREAMDELRSYGGFQIVGHNMSASVGQIEAMIDRLEPDIVFIDGMYLVKPTGFNHKMSRNDKLEALANELAAAASTYQIPIVGSVQLNRDQKSKAKEVDLANVFGSDAWAQNADYVFALLQSKEDRADRVMRASLIKGRNCPVFASRLAWDLDDMVFDLLEYEEGTISIAHKAATPKPAVTW